MKAEQLTPVITMHGEGPVYSPRWRGPRLVDMLAGDILEIRQDGTCARAHVGEVAAAFRPRKTGGLIIGIERGVALTSNDELDADVSVLPEMWTDPNVRMNEGGCDPSGAFYCGTTTYDHEPGAGRLFRFGSSLQSTTAVNAVTVSNGIDWTVAGDSAYYVDSVTKRIDRFTWTPEGGLRDRRPFVRVDGVGEPDGLTVDSENGVWVAVWGGSAVHRYDARGDLTEIIELPVSQVSAVAFAGPMLDELIITTSRKGLGDGAEKAAGAVFTARPGVAGQPVREFGG